MPLLMAGPGITPRLKVRVQTTHADLAATLLGLAGAMPICCLLLVEACPC